MTDHIFIREVLKGNEDATRLCLLLFAISQTWDDLIDEGASADVNQMMVATLLELPANPFYCEHHAKLMPVIQTAVIDWLTANDLEQGSAHERTLAFVLRDSLSAVVIQCAAIIGGISWAIAQAPRIRRFNHDEHLSTYLEGLK